jgi:hypothetical protein
MQIARDSLDTRAGPSDWFTGAVDIDTVPTLSDASRPARQQKLLISRKF